MYKKYLFLYNLIFYVDISVIYRSANIRIIFNIPKFISVFLNDGIGTHKAGISSGIYVWGLYVVGEKFLRTKAFDFLVISWAIRGRYVGGTWAIGGRHFLGLSWVFLGSSWVFLGLLGYFLGICTCFLGQLFDCNQHGKRS